MLKKRLRMTLDFEVVVEDVTDETLRDWYRQFTNFDETVGDAELWANISRQIRLQRALLEDEEALNRYLTYVVTVEVDPSIDSKVGEVFGVGGEHLEEEIFGPLFSRLGEEDERFFREMSEEGVLFDNIEVLSWSFKISWAGATLEEIRAVAEDSFDDQV